MMHGKVERLNSCQVICYSYNMENMIMIQVRWMTQNTDQHPMGDFMNFETPTTLIEVRPRLKVNWRRAMMIIGNEHLRVVELWVNNTMVWAWGMGWLVNPSTYQPDDIA